MWGGLGIVAAPFVVAATAYLVSAVGYPVRVKAQQLNPKPCTCIAAKHQLEILKFECSTRRLFGVVTIVTLQL